MNMMRKESDMEPKFICVICKEEKDLCVIGECNHHKICSYFFRFRQRFECAIFIQV